MRHKNIKSIVDISDFAYLHARGGSTAAARASFFERSIQLSTTGIFCRFLKKCCTIKYYVRKIRILGKHEIQYLIVLYYYFLNRQKIPVVLNCKLRSKKEAGAAAVEPHNFITHLKIGTNALQ